MAGKIPRPFIDDLLSRVDIVELIGSRVPLRKAGKDFQARCPFHDEKTPSFTVSRDKQFYHCFGCGAHGSAIGFLMDYDHLGFVDAIETLAQQAGVEVPHEAGARQGPDSRPLYELMASAQGYFQEQLRRHPAARRAGDYLKRRGLSGEIANAYAIGYAPPGWDNLLKHFGNDPESVKRMTLTGLLAENESGRRYDRFRDRIIFPIRDPRGRTIGFGGRVLDDSKPKYLNSPETPLFHKGREVYGLFEARQAGRQLDRLLVTEGYMDVIALAQFGIRYAVATLGTAATGDHLERLFRTTPELVFCFDGDQAGRDAAWKALEQALPLMREGREARFLFLPQGEDPDSLIRREGQVAFEKRLEQARPLSTFLFDKLAEGLDMGSDEGRARLFELARPRLQRLPEGVFREMMLQRLAQLIELPRDRLGVGAAPRAAPRPRRPQGPQRITPLRLAIGLLVQHPGLAEPCRALPEDWRCLAIPGVELLGQILDLMWIEPNLTTAALIERWRESPHFTALNRLAAHPFQVPEGGEETELRGAILRLNEQQQESELEQLLSKAQTTQISGPDKQRLIELLASRSERRGNGDSAS